MKRGFMVFMITLMVSLPFASAGVFDFLNREIQLSSSESQDATLSIGNDDPIVDVTSATITSPIIEGSTGVATIVFTVTDANGQGDIDMSGGSEAILVLIQNGPESRQVDESACPGPVVFGSNGYTYTCTITMQFYDAELVWDVDVDVTDASGGTGTADDLGEDPDNLNVPQLVSIALSPIEIDFGPVVLSGTNIQSPPTVVTNNGNYNIDSSVTDKELTVTGFGLVHTTLPTNVIDVDQFRSADAFVDGAEVCSGPAGVNHDQTANILNNFVLAKGTQAVPLSTRDIDHCLVQVPSAIAGGTYNTGGNQWVFNVNTP